MPQIFFNATKDQILEAAALAFNHSESANMGLLHYKPEHEATAKEMEPYWIGGELHCDWVEGRCMKFRVWKPYGESYGYKYATGYQTQDEYETWRTKYPTYLELLHAAGISDLRVVA